MSQLRELCPTNTTWGETEEYVSNVDWGSDLRICWEHGHIWAIAFRFSPLADSRALLDRFVAIARDEQCLLLEERTRAVFEPADDLVSAHLQNSRAVRFMRDPQGTIIEGASGSTIADHL